jgi:hypothetical protein
MNPFGIETNFDVAYNDKTLQVEMITMGKRDIYVVKHNGQPLIMVTRATDANGVKFWTSIPEGKQKLAEVIGELIADHIRKSL